MSFTWFDKFSDAIDKIPNQGDKDTFALAIVNYGMTGVEPELPYPLNALFAICKEDIEHSVKARTNNAGGRPKKTQGEEPEAVLEVTEDVTGEVIISRENTEKPPSTTPPKNPPTKPNTIQNNTEQYNTEQNKRERVRTSFAPPAPAQVREYAEDKGINIDPERFCDYFAAQGWRISNGNPMKDWKAAVRNWAAREGPATRYRGKVQGQEVESGFDYDAYCGF
jgi:hypothetical protein